MIICKNCKAQLADNELICRYCGARISSEIPTARAVYPNPAQSIPYHGSAGYSDLIDSEEVTAALKKNKRVSNIAVLVFVLLPVLGFVIYGAVSDKMEIGNAAVYGLIVSAVSALAAIFVALRQKLSKPFEGAVADKKIRRTRRSYDHTGVSRSRYLIRFDCADGKRRKKEVSTFVYDYLQIGDRVRYLPQFPQPFEKYDKRPDGDVMCMFCGRRNPLTETNCVFCHKPLIK